MTAGLEIDAAEEFIYATLRGDAALLGLVTDIFNSQAPQGAAYPFAVFQAMSGTDLMVVDSIRVWTGLQFLVKIIGQTSDYGDLRAAVARVDAVLHRVGGTVADGTVWSCVREQTIRMTEAGPGGEQYRHAGGMYRLLAS